MRHGHRHYPVRVRVKPACPQCSHSVCVCYYAEADHIRRSLLSTDEKVMVTTGKGTGFLDEPFKSPQSSDSHHLVCLFPVSLLKHASQSGMEISAKNSTLVIHWLNPHAESTADTAAICNSPSHFTSLNFLSQAPKTCKQLKKTFLDKVLLLAFNFSTCLKNCSIQLVYQCLSPSHCCCHFGVCVCVCRRMMNLHCHSCHS